MGLFFNYDKPGPGIDKNAPKKKGVRLYLELLWRKLSKILLANMLYVLVSLPVIVIYYLGNMAFFPVIDAASSRLAAIATTLLIILWGSGPVSCGYTMILRNFAREEHVWLGWDFFRVIKQNFLRGLAFLLLDFAVLMSGVTAIRFYSALYAQGKTWALFLMSMIFLIFVIYTFMHYYMYQFSITFEGGFKATIKNSFIMALACLPMNALLTLFAVAFTYLLFVFMTSFGAAILLFVCWITFMRFPIDFYTARIIKRKFIDPLENEEGDL